MRIPTWPPGAIVPELVMPPTKFPLLMAMPVPAFVILLWLSIEMPPVMVEVSALSTIPPTTVLAFVSTMPFGLIVPELVIVLVIVELLMAMPVIVAALVQPGDVVLVKDVVHAARAGGAPPPPPPAADQQPRDRARRQQQPPPAAADARLHRTTSSSRAATCAAAPRNGNKPMNGRCDGAMKFWDLLVSFY